MIECVNVLKLLFILLVNYCYFSSHVESKSLQKYNNHICARLEKYKID